MNIWCRSLHLPCVKVASMLVVLNRRWGSCGSGGRAVASAIAGLLAEWSGWLRLRITSVHWKVKCCPAHLNHRHVWRQLQNSCDPQLLWCCWAVRTRTRSSAIHPFLMFNRKSLILKIQYRAFQTVTKKCFLWQAAECFYPKCNNWLQP